MKKSTKTLELKFERTIPAPPTDVYDAWLNPKFPGNPWNMGDKLLLNPKVDGFFYWLVHGTPHYGRFTRMERPRRIQHTWMSPYTLGQESTVTVTFKKKGEDTLMTLVHTDLPDTEEGKAHEDGWNDFMESFPKQFTVASGKGKKKRGKKR
ncbi:MAG: hypothetical protein JWO30_4531 [Fibrobacteres bacterium]|nr:hypothetical protein [Fibrobacterota bacterium]